MPPGASSITSLERIGVLNFGDINHFWSTSLGPTTNDKMPWTYADLQRFEATSANRLHVHLLTTVPTTANGNSARVLLDYVALRVQYCEEQRVVLGGRQVISPSYVGGVNIITLRDTARTADPTLAAGTYTATLSWVNPGDINFGFGTDSEFPPLNALRELYSVPYHPGVQVNIPFPLEDHTGDEFTVETTHILPQLSIHVTGGGPVTEVHAYGRQAAAQIYGVNTATQEIEDSLVGGTASYQQVRFYARRFGDTTQPLLVTGVGPISGSSASVSVATFDALDEIIDGWKEVTLRFGSAPTLGALTSPDPSFTWSSAAETKGNRWEILGVSAPAVSGTPGNVYNLAPATQQLYTATYEPPNGNTVELIWMPQGISSPPVTGASADQGTDAVLILSQDPPTITGVALATQSQSITGFTECSHGPCCTPSAITYHRITWSGTTLPTTGFGAYELQRMDPITDWQTIMLATNPAVTGFSDYEMRVGVMSSYRIRQLNVLDFAGGWSVTVTGTPTEPGVTMPACGSSKRGVLIFTSNESQAGAYNLAYAMTWEGDVREEFSFVEAGDVQFFQRLDANFQVAFHGTERGGESFTRTLLLSNAAVALPRLGNTRSLRDMAWADLAYVCVRDDIGDRWFASVIVPGTVVRRNRRLYNSEITVVETTSTANPVNP